MNAKGKVVCQIYPDLIERPSGGWLAVAPAASPVRFGVTGYTKEDAIEKFSLSARAWAETIYGDGCGLLDEPRLCASAT